MLGKVAIVTGASRGNGLRTSQKLAAAGADVFLVSDDAEGLQQAVEQCRRTNPVAKVGGGVFDLGSCDGPQDMATAAVKAFRRIDVLINNAVTRVGRPFGEYSCADFDRLIAVNLRAAFLASQAVLPAMRAQGGGRIIHVASQLGSVAYKNTLLYGVAKAGLIYLARAMAYELARENIVVNSISPGVILSERNAERFSKNPAAEAERLAYIPAGRAADPDEIAEAILYLAATAPAYLQGHNLVIDGGYTTH